LKKVGSYAIPVRCQAKSFILLWTGLHHWLADPRTQELAKDGSQGSPPLPPPPRCLSPDLRPHPYQARLARRFQQAS